MRSTVGAASSSQEALGAGEPPRFVGMLYSRERVNEGWLYVVPRARDPRWYVSAAYDPAGLSDNLVASAPKALSMSHEQETLCGAVQARHAPTEEAEEPGA